KDVSFVDVLDGWGVGQQGTPGASTAPAVLVTHDGGATWTEQSTGVAAGADESLYGADFVSATTGWVVGTGPTGSIILGTIDGGATWDPETLPDGVAQPLVRAPAAVPFSDTQHRGAAGSDAGTAGILGP